MTGLPSRTTMREGLLTRTGREAGKRTGHAWTDHGHG